MMDQVILHRTLIETFRRARWPETEGQPVCPLCHDGEDVREGYQKYANRPFGRSYYCKPCRYGFSDFTRTPLHRSTTNLIPWARVALGDPRLTTKAEGPNRPLMVRRRRASEASALMARWAGALISAGVTIEQLRQATNGGRAR